jgi:hypothetical protein
MRMSGSIVFKKATEIKKGIGCPARAGQLRPAQDAILFPICFILTEGRSSCNISPLLWGCSSAGRVLDWQSRGRRFDPGQLHHLLSPVFPIKTGNLRKFSYPVLSCLFPSFSVFHRHFHRHRFGNPYRNSRDS